MQNENNNYKLVLVGIAGISVGVILSAIFYKEWFENDCQNNSSIFNETLGLSKKELEMQGKCENFLNFAIGFTVMTGVSFITIIFAAFNIFKENNNKIKNQNTIQELREVNIIANEPTNDDLSICTSGSILLSSIRTP